MSETNEAWDKTGDWRDAIGVLKDCFPDGMKSEDIIWCQYAGMELEEFMLMQKGGINPRDYESTIAAYNAWLWEQSERPEVVEAVAKRIHKWNWWESECPPLWEEVGDEGRDYCVRMATIAAHALLTALIGPKGETT